MSDPNEKPKLRTGPKTTKRARQRYARNVDQRAKESEEKHGRKVKRSKYRAKGTYVGDVWCASQAEAARYRQLLAMREAGEIDRLETQPKIECSVNGRKICTYIPDFRYDVIDDRGHVLRHVVEDVKGMRTATYRLKKKLTEALHAVTVHEVPASKVAKYEGLAGDEKI